MPSFHVTSSRKKNPDKHVYIAVPSYGELMARFVHSLNGAKDVLISNNISVDIAFLTGNCHVDDARNDMCRMFLESEATDLVFIDADVVFSTQSILQLLSHPVDIVGGVYPEKNDDVAYPVLLPDGGELKISHGSLVEVHGLPGGFLRVTRKAMQAAYDNAAKRGVWSPKGNYGTLPLAEIFYRATLENDRPNSPYRFKRRSGDYQFCFDMRRLGFTLYCDPNLTLGHVGLKVWTGNIGRHWMERSGAWERMLPAAVADLQAMESPEKCFGALETMANAFGNKPWAADPVLLGVLHAYASAPEIDTILETGSGVSTAALMATGKKVVSLEAEPIWGQKTEKFLRDCGFNDSPLVYAPIRPHAFGRWYDYRAISSPDLIFVDGPKREENGMRARFVEAMPAEKAKVIILDDVDDTDGRHLMERVEKLGFAVDVVKNPARRDFAVAEKKAA